MGSLPKYLAVFLLISLLGCYNVQKNLDKSYRKDPVKTLEYLKDKAPCISDTIYHNDTAFDFIELPGQTITDTVRQNDTVLLRLVKKDTIRQIKTVTKTVKERDTRQEKILENNLAASNERQEYYRGKSEGKAEWIKWLLIVLAVSLLGNVIQFKLK